MYIYSLDRKTIIKAIKLSISKNFGGKKEEKYCIIAENGHDLQAVVAAVFADEKTAIDALEKAFQAFESGAKFYKFD